MTQSHPLQLSILYAHKDEQFRRELEKHLSLLRQQNILEVWSDRAIEAGQEWEKSIHDALEGAEIILLLISPDFLASGYIYDKELKQAMERHEAGKARVIPVSLRPCDWRGAPFGKLQGVPDNAKPISQWRNRDEAFTIVTTAIRRAAEFLGSVQVKHRPESETTQSHPLQLSILYAHKDEQFQRELEKHLSLLRQQNILEVWSDRSIEAGQEWEQSISEKLEIADIIVLLISPDFVSSKYIYEKELKRAMERHETGEARVIPVSLRPSFEWKDATLAKLQDVLDKPISQWRNRDEAFTIVTMAIRRAAEFLGSVQVKHRPESDEKTPNASPSGQGQQTAEIFISYAKEDRDRVESLARALAAAGWSVWWDRKIPFGKPFDQVIEEALIKARCIIVIWSSHSIHSHWVREEAENGRQRNILIPILIEQITPPFGFRRIQTADFTNWDNSQRSPEFRELIDNITSTLELTEEKTKHAAENLTYKLERTLVKGKDRPVTGIIKILNNKLIGIFIFAIIIALIWYILFIPM